jgi:hypothetical protein
MGNAKIQSADRELAMLRTFARPLETGSKLCGGLALTMVT